MLYWFPLVRAGSEICANSNSGVVVSPPPLGLSTYVPNVPVGEPRLTPAPSFWHGTGNVIATLPSLVQVPASTLLILGAMPIACSVPDTGVFGEFVMSNESNCGVSTH